MSKIGRVIFGGAGPGAEDLVTLRLHNAIKESDIIVYAGSLVNTEILTVRKSGSTLCDSASMNLDEIISVMVNGIRNGKKVLRVHTGDPAMYGAIAEQIKRLDAEQIEYEIIPGVSSVFAAAAAVKKELTLPGITQTMILTRRAGRTPVPPKERLELLAAHQTSMGLFLSVGAINNLAQDLISAGYKKETPVYVVYRASWPDQKIIEATLESVAQKVGSENITRQAIILVGNALSGKGEESLLYDKDFTHGYRDGAGHITDVHTSKEVLFPFRFSGKVAIWAITENGFNLAQKIAKPSNGTVFISKKYFLESDINILSFEKGAFDKTIKENWKKFDAHIFIMSTGIVVRKISKLINSKLDDPAVVTLDEKGLHAISLLSGHIGGGNELTKIISDIVGALPIITTATDILGRIAFDTIASELGWSVSKKNSIKKLNMLLVSGKKIALIWPEYVSNKYYKNSTIVKSLNSANEISDVFSGVVTVDLSVDEINKLEKQFNIPVLNFIRPTITIGVGVRAGGDFKELDRVLNSALEKCGSTRLHINKIATVDIKKNELAILKLQKMLSVELAIFSSSELSKVEVPTPSKKVLSKVGTSSVSEAAAILGSNKNRIIISKQKGKTVTVAIAI